MDHVFAVRQYTQAALRDIIGNNEMDFVLMEREQIAESIQNIVDQETRGWGVDVEAIKIQEIFFITLSSVRLQVENSAAPLNAG